MHETSYDDSNVFNQIVENQLKVPFKKEIGEYLVIKDANPQAWQHYLIISRWKCVHLLSEKFKPETGVEIHSIMQEIISGHPESTGYRLKVNGLPSGNQVVPHLHLHFLLFKD